MAKYLIENHGDAEHTLRPSGAEDTTLPPGQNFTGQFNKDEASRMHHARGLRVTEVKPEPKPEPKAEAEAPKAAAPKATRPAKRSSKKAVAAPVEPVAAPVAEAAAEAVPEI